MLRKHENKECRTKPRNKRRLTTHFTSYVRTAEAHRRHIYTEVVNFASEVIAKAEYYNQNLPDNRSDNCRFDKATFLPEEKCCKCLFRYIDVQRSISNITNPLSPPLDSRTSHLRTSFFKLIFGFVFPVPVFSRVVSSRELVYCVA